MVYWHDQAKAKAKQVTMLREALQAADDHLKHHVTCPANYDMECHCGLDNLLVKITQALTATAAKRSEES